MSAPDPNKQQPQPGSDHASSDQPVTNQPESIQPESLQAKIKDGASTKDQPNNQQTSKTEMPKIKETQKNKDALKKWLPAIILAIVVHLLIFGLLITNHYKMPATSDEQATDALSTEQLAAALSQQPDALLTLTEADLTQEEGDDADDEIANDKDVDTNTEEVEGEQDLENTNAEDSTNAHSDQQATDAAKPTAHNSHYNHNASVVAPLDESMIDSYQPPAPSYPSQPASNPYDHVLLPRDIPASNQRSASSPNLTEEAQAAQQLSDQLSDVINEVKEQKLREIAAEQGKKTADIIHSLQLVEPPTDTATVVEAE
ncbi:hypothetical protein [Psychrobacter lutiphocae]|uniref:hypothetical protein n=1 Tax=Psychrobacter lutiphocae TaxID=540500 RepID=UPI00036330DD|nr:hypothetical protein [Psychrobacter lutiphocae]